MRTSGSVNFFPCPSDFSLGGVVEIIRMFQAASPASHQPAFRPTRGSGDGAVPDTIGVTGLGIVFGGTGGGGGGVPPRPPRPPAAFAAASGCPAAGAADAGCCAGAAAGCCDGGGVAGAAAGADGDVCGGGAVFDDPPHAAMPAAITTAVK